MTNQKPNPVMDARKRKPSMTREPTMISDADEDTLLNSCKQASAYLKGVSESDNWPRMAECQELLDELKLRYEILHSLVNRDIEGLFYEALAARREEVREAAGDGDDSWQTMGTSGLPTT